MESKPGRSARARNSLRRGDWFDVQFKQFGLVVLALLSTTLVVAQFTWNGDAVVSANMPAAGSNATPTPPRYFFPFVTKNYIPPSPLWRFGVGRVRRPISNYDSYGLTTLRLGWYTDWTATYNAPQPDAMEYLPTVRLKQWKQYDDLTWTLWCMTCSYVSPYTYTVSPGRSVIQSIAAARPGMTWIIGNEIERIDWPNGGYQDEILPEVYAVAYHELYTLVKTADPTAQIAIGGVIQATPLRLLYLQRVWTAYQNDYGTAMPVDVWNVHGFVLQEYSCLQTGICAGADIPAGFTASEGITYTTGDYNKNFSTVWNNIVALRQWMASIGQRNKPLYITEYGVLLPPDYTGYSYPEVRDSFMYPSFNAFLNQTDSNIGFASDGNRLVQRWNWYSLDDDNGFWDQGTYYQYFNGNLFYSGLGGNPQGMSPLGTYWLQYVGALPSGGKPYAPQRSNTQLLSTSAEWPLVPQMRYPSQCNETTRVRLLFSEPSLPKSPIGDISIPEAHPSPTRESTICAPVMPWEFCSGDCGWRNGKVFPSLH